MIPKTMAQFVVIPKTMADLVVILIAMADIVRRREIRRRARKRPGGPGKIGPSPPKPWRRREAVALPRGVAVCLRQSSQTVGSGVRAWPGERSKRLQNPKLDLK